MNQKEIIKLPLPDKHKRWGGGKLRIWLPSVWLVTFEIQPAAGVWVDAWDNEHFPLPGLKGDFGKTSSLPYLVPFPPLSTSAQGSPQFFPLPLITSNLYHLHLITLSSALAFAPFSPISTRVLSVSMEGFHAFFNPICQHPSVLQA